MLRSATVGLVSAIALGVSMAAAPSAVTAGQFGAGAGGMRGGGNAGGGAVHGSNMGGSAIRGGNVGGSNMMVIRSDFSSGRVVQHDMGHDMGHDIGHDLGRMRMADHDHDRDRDRDHDRDRHDHDRFRFFPAFAFGVDTYSDYDPDYSCFELHRVWTHAGWRLRRVWVCD